MHALLPPHHPRHFVSTSEPFSIGVSFTGHRSAVTQSPGRGTHTFNIAPGTAGATSDLLVDWLRVNEPSECVEIYVSDPTRQGVADELRTPGAAALTEIADARDAVVWAVAVRFRRALMTPNAMDALEADTLARLLLTHVMTVYCGAAPPDRARGRLDRRRLERTVEYIDARLDGALTLARLAEVAGLSTFHFARSFRLTTGLAPYQFVKARRMERARRLLRESDMSVHEVAAAVGYATPSHFRRNYRRHFGIRPSEDRRGA